jgi:DNA replication protein DnaC
MIPDNKLIRIKTKIKTECQKCNGDGCHVCLSKISRLEKYRNANIPVEYWNLSFKDFSGDPNFKTLIKSKLEDINSVYDAGKSLIFTGGLGTGKTYTACSFLKIALTSGYTALYTTMADVVANMLSREVDTSRYYSELIEKDFLVIDEFSSHWIFPSEKAEQLFGTSLEYVLRTRFQNQLPTILCSNDNDVDKIFGGFFAKSFKSLRSHHVELFIVGGKDHRRMDARS